jgi:hypothetical protein
MAGTTRRLQPQVPGVSRSLVPTSATPANAVMQGINRLRALATSQTPLCLSLPAFNRSILLPQRHAAALQGMLQRHGLICRGADLSAGFLLLAFSLAT